MRYQDSSRSRLHNYRPGFSKYFDWSQNSRQARCKLCKNVIQTIKDGTGLLRLHLEDVHSIMIFKNYQASQNNIQSRNSQPIQDYQSYQAQQYSHGYRGRDIDEIRDRQRQIKTEKMLKNKDKWLKFIRQVVPSSDDEEAFDEKEEQMKFMVHGTQFTDPLKYIQFTRYSDDQLNEIKQQLYQLPNLSKIPAMVTLAQSQDIQAINNNKQTQNLYYLDRNWQCQRSCITEIKDKHKQKYEVKEWRIIAYQNNNIQQNQQVIEIDGNQETANKKINEDSLNLGQLVNNAQQELNQNKQAKSGSQNAVKNIVQIKEGQNEQIQRQGILNNQKMQTVIQQSDNNKVTVNMGIEVNNQTEKVEQAAQLSNCQANKSQGAVANSNLIINNEQQKNNEQQLQQKEGVQQKLEMSQAEMEDQGWVEKDGETLFKLLHKQMYEIVQIKSRQKQDAKTQQFKCAVIANEAMKLSYSKYADAVSITSFVLNNTTVLLVWVQNWRLHCELAGIILLHTHQIKGHELEAALVAYFDMMGLIPISVYIVSNSLHPQLCAKLREVLQRIIGIISITTKCYAHIQIYEQTNSNAANTPNTQHSRIYSAYDKLIISLQNTISKYNQNYDAGPQFTTRLAIKNNSKLLRRLPANLHSQGDGKDNKKQLYLNPLTYASRIYKGFAVSSNKLSKICEHFNSRAQKYLQQNSNQANTKLGKVIDIILRSLQGMLQEQVGEEIKIYGKCSKMVIHNPYIKSIRHKIAPRLYAKVCRIYKLTKNITHIKYISPTHLELYSVMPGNKTNSSNNDGNTDNVHESDRLVQSISQCKAYKHTVLYNETQMCWECNCNREVEVGLPCCHIMRVVIKMRGSLQYYVHQRWRPNQDELQQLIQDWNIANDS